MRRSHSVLLAALLLVVRLAECDWIVEPGPQNKASQGAVWPKPQQQEFNNETYSLNPYNFAFVNEVGECLNVNSAIKRYKQILVNSLPEPWKYNKQDDANPILSSLNIFLNGSCESPLEFNMNENYELTVISGNGSRLVANTYWGIIRGLETFSQLVFFNEETKTVQIKGSKIVDYPRFAHRGLMIDTSRHFIPVEVILTILDGMSYTKMNVFHWHIVDDQSFPYESITFPELSQKGAYHETMVYSQADVAKIIAYAKSLGIRVLAEFDSPGHTRCWGVSHPELLTACYKDGKPDGTYGAVDPTLNTTYAFFEKLLQEITTVFPDKYLHLGGDEVGFECWMSNPDLVARMKALGLENGKQLEELFIQKLVDMSNKLNASVLVWEEVFSNGVVLKDNAIVHVWKKYPNPQQKLHDVTAAGFHALLSSNNYLSDVQNGGDWHKYYDNDPWNFPGTDEQKKLVLGGEACMWGEHVDETNILPRIWPRAAAVAERLWSAQSVTDKGDANKRMEEHACRLNRRGIEAQPPTGPGFCLV